MRSRNPFNEPLSSLDDADRIAALDRQVLWKPFTQMRGYVSEEPLIVAEGRGAWLRDVHGRSFLDANASLWLNVHGHNDPALVEAVREQLGRLDHATLLGPSNDQAVLFAAELLEQAPEGLSRVFYSDNGSTSVEVAVKMAYQYQQQCGHSGACKRKSFVTMGGAYHGDTLGSVSVGGMDLFHGIYKPLLFETLQLKQPDYFRRPDGRSAEEHTEALLLEAAILFERVGEEVAAFVVEPLVQGAAGMVTYPAELLRGLVDLAREAGALVIVDEVATGFGRTGSMWACSQAGVDPDLMALAKGISGGMLPLAATLCREEIFEAFLGEHDEYKTFFHGHSYTGNPLACAAARASLRLFEERQVLERVGGIAQALGAALEPLAAHPHVGDVRRIGVMCAVELVADRVGNNAFPADRRVAAAVCQRMTEVGVLIRPLGEAVIINPPYCISDDEVAWLGRELIVAIDAECRP